VLTLLGRYEDAMRHRADDVVVNGMDYATEQVNALPSRRKGR